MAILTNKMWGYLYIWGRNWDQTSEKFDPRNSQRTHKMYGKHPSSLSLGSKDPSQKSRQLETVIGHPNEAILAHHPQTPAAAFTFQPFF
jgi:hypothetical protein